MASTEPVAPLRVLLGLNDGGFSVRTTTNEPTGDAGVGCQLRRARSLHIGDERLCGQRGGTMTEDRARADIESTVMVILLCGV